MAWFKDWFGTPYYKMLYRHRNDEEASVFLDNVVQKRMNDLFNAFTSFGYFDTEEEDIKTLCNVRNALEDSGCFVIDYLNSTKVAKEILPHSKSTCEKVHFDIRKHIENKFIIKDIIVDDDGEEYHFSERVKLLDKNDFEKYFTTAGLEITAVFGNYKLETFNENSSERLILIAKKSNLQA